MASVQELAADAWQLYREQHTQTCVNCPLPILYFGDVGAYLKSQLRVVTLGKNPSAKEFEPPNALAKVAAALHERCLSGTESSYDEYLQSLNGYFEHEHYDFWFANYQAVLGGLGHISYYSRGMNRALHTDLCTPLSTQPPYSELSDDERKSLEPAGVQLWRRLITFLRPHVILISFGREYVKALCSESPDIWPVAYTLERDGCKPYHVRYRTLRLDGGQDTLVFFGRAAEVPFGTVSRLHLNEIGRGLRNFLGQTVRSEVGGTHAGERHDGERAG